MLDFISSAGARVQQRAELYWEPRYEAQHGLILSSLLTINFLHIRVFYSHFIIAAVRRYGDSADNAVDENSSVFSLIEALVALSKGMRAGRLCTNKILQFLAGGAGQHRLTCVMAVKRVVDWVGWFYCRNCVLSVGDWRDILHYIGRPQRIVIELASY